MALRRAERSSFARCMRWSKTVPTYRFEYHQMTVISIKVLYWSDEDDQRLKRREIQTSPIRTL